MTEQDEPHGAQQPWRAPPPGTYVSPWTTGYAPVPPYRRPRRRVLPGLVAGVVALALAGGGALYSTQLRLHGSGTLSAAPADTSATRRDPGPAPSVPAPAPTAADPVLTVPQVSAVVTPGVVVITADLGTQNAEAAGTGMVLTPTGEILTNNHVIAGATSIDVTVVNTHTQYTADVVGTSPENDVAVLQLRAAGGLSTIPLGNSDTVRKGQSVVAIGNAGGRGELDLVSGNVASIDQAITASDANGGNKERLTGMISAEADIKAGDSGGPLADRAGRVIGMNTAASATDAGSGEPTYGFAIPINRALAVAETIRSTAGTAPRTSRGYLGVQVRGAIPPGGGAQVQLATPGSPAYAAGLAPGDVITTLDGDPVDSPAGLTGSLAATAPGQRVTLGWTDTQGRQRLETITLGRNAPD